MQLKVKYVKLHTPYFDVGCGNLGDTLGDPNKHKHMDITWTPDGLFVEFKGVTFGVPLTACVGYTFTSPAEARTYLHWKNTGQDLRPKESK